MKKVVFFIVIVLFLFIINNFFHSIYRLWQKQDLIETARRDLVKERQEQKQLESQLREVEQYSYIEKEARNKLFFVKPGEQVVLMPSTSVSQKMQPKPVGKADPAWIQWYNVFF